VRTVPALIVSAALLATLTACAPLGGSAACEPVIPEGESPSFVRAEGEVGAVPEVSFPTPLRTEGAQRSVLVPGEGDPIAAGQIVDFQVSLFSGVDGELITQSSYDDTTNPLRRTAGADMDVLAEVVQCAQVGSRIAATGTIADVFGAGTLDPALGLADDDSVVLVLDIEAAYLGKATGLPQLGAQGVPAVVTAPDGRPGITVPNQDPPTELIDHVLTRGDGAEVAEGDRVVMHYTGLDWETEAVFDSSWERGAPATFPAVSFLDQPDGIVPGLAEAIVGKTVGSQVVVVIPPELGYPEGQAPATIPAGSTMVFVVDILGIEGRD
jgi:peptidylprolyl isomerase